ncbi:hypothetical protein CRENBAI_008002 [Crenichthys baileyi]|uniref:Uncharacterized protein n=1 Tax=Crenichthys baileyi TaxID=28760 RepID=A0AAV9RKF2_9TELE
MRHLADEPCPPSAMPHLVPSRNFGLSPAPVKDLPSKSSPQHFPGPHPSPPGGRLRLSIIITEFPSSLILSPCK